MHVKPNMGFVDRFTRILFAIVFISHGLNFNWFWMFVAGVLLAVTALRGHCPIYNVFKVSSVGWPKDGSFGG